MMLNDPYPPSANVIIDGCAGLFIKERPLEIERETYIAVRQSLNLSGDINTRINVLCIHLHLILI